MRFIRFARSVNEQNMTAYQHGESIYYQAFCDINIGEELLVWYSDCYDKYLEIPVNLKRVEGIISLKRLDEVFDCCSPRYLCIC